MRSRDGFTIVEILLALLLLSFVVLGFQAATGEIIHYAARSDRALVAVQLAEDRIELIRLDPVYEQLESRYEQVESSIAGYPGLVRTTLLARTNQTLTTGVLDYWTITVEITGRAIPDTVSRSIVVAAP